MKTYFSFWLFLFSLFVVNQGYSREISSTAELRRISLLLKGEIPSQSEFNRVLNSSNPRDVIDGIVSEYLKSPQFTLRMRVRVQELFRMRQEDTFHRTKIAGLDDNSNSKKDLLGPNASEENTNALDQLVLETISKNASWDNLLISKKYQFKVSSERKVGGQEFSLMLPDWEFFKSVFPNELGNVDYDESNFLHVEAKTKDQKLSLAGAITTSRFFSRNQTTKVNKNRRRAAAVFRTFLCDDLKPVILPNASEDKENLRLAIEGYPSEAQGEDVISEERLHAEDEQCKSCHFMLEPLAKTFKGSSLALNNKASPGALVFRRRDGTVVNIPAKGIGQIAEEIAKQPEYAQCQVKHFWNWFIGKDVYLPRDREQHLVTEFNRVGRRTQDFIRVLIRLPEFRTIPYENQIITSSYVQPLLQTCNQCHANEKFKNGVPNLQIYPFSNDIDENKQILKDLVKSIDLRKMGESKTMPPRDVSWSLSVDDFNLLNIWISQGARDDRGKIYLTKTQVDRLLPTELQNHKRVYKTTFDDTYFRFLSGYDFKTAIASIFNLQSQDIINSGPQRALGFKDPANGAPAISTPGVATIESYISELESVIPQYLKKSENIFNLSNRELSQDWKLISSQKKRALVKSAIDFTIGPLVMNDKDQKKFISLIESRVSSLVKNKNKFSVRDVIGKVLFLILSSEKFQSI